MFNPFTTHKEISLLKHELDMFKNKQEDEMKFGSFFGTSDYWERVTLGQVAGKVNSGIIGDNPSVEPGTIETLWNVGGLYVYLTADTTLFASSSDASDTDTYVILGLNELYEPITAIVTLNGTTPVALSAKLFRVRVIVNINPVGTGSVGDVYVAESTALTAGVPDDLTKAKIKVPAGDNIASNGTFTTTKDEIGYQLQIEGTVGKAKDSEFIERARFFGQELFTHTTKWKIYQSTFQLSYAIGFFVPPKTDIEFSFITNDVSSPVTALSRIETTKITI